MIQMVCKDKYKTLAASLGQSKVHLHPKEVDYYMIYTVSFFHSSYQEGKSMIPMDPNLTIHH